MAVTSGSKIQYEYMLGGGSPPVIQIGEQTDSTGWVAGAILAIDSSGHVYTAATGAITSATACFGIALHDSCGSTADGSALASVVLITPMTVFSAVVYHATTASAVVQSGQIGDTFATADGGSSKCWVMSIATTASVGMYCINNKDATGTAYGRNYFVFSGCYATDSPWGYGTS